MTVGSGPEGPTWPDAERWQASEHLQATLLDLHATLQESRALRQQSQQARARAQATRDQVLRGRSRRDILRDSAFARLAAKQKTMPVIEQAKGILMDQHGCGPEEAFDLLRRASQRVNVKVHVLAAQLIERTVPRDSIGNVIPISPGATRHLRPETRTRPPAGRPLARLKSW